MVPFILGYNILETAVSVMSSSTRHNSVTLTETFITCLSTCLRYANDLLHVLVIFTITIRRSIEKNKL